MSSRNLTLEEVESAWYGAWNCGHVPDWVEDEVSRTGDASKVFDRWLNSVKAEAWEECSETAIYDYVYGSVIHEVNPYRTGGAE